MSGIKFALRLLGRQSLAASTVLALLTQSGCAQPEGAGKMDAGQHAVFGKQLVVINPASPRDPFAGAAISPDGTRVVTISLHGTYVVLWDAVTGREIKRYQRNLNLETRSSNAIAFAPDSSFVAVPFVGADYHDKSEVSLATSMSILDTKDGHVLRSLAGTREPVGPNKWHSAGNIAISSNGRRLVGASDAVPSNIVVYDTTVWEIVGEIKNQFPSSLALNPTGKWLAVGDGIGGLALLEAATGAKKWKIPAHNLKDITDGDGTEVGQVLFDPSGSRIFTAAGSTRSYTPAAAAADPELKRFEDEIVRSWSADTGKRVASYLSPPHKPNEISVQSIVLRPNGEILVATQWKSNLIAFDMATGAVLDQLDTRPAPLQSATFSADGTKLLVAAFNVAVILEINLRSEGPVR